MIQLSRNYSLPERENDLLPIKIVGVGGAGSNALDRVVLDGLDKADVVAANTDAQALAGSVAMTKVQLGREATRGLGAGGDPEVGCNAAIESADELRAALDGARVIFICAGLGGGTGSGAAPLIAEIATDTGALVIAFATMPFSFEGKRRGMQAQEALERLQKFSDAVICFENDKLGDIVAPKAGIHQAFATADMTISQSLRSIVAVIQRPGLIRIGFDDLRAALRAPNGRCLFGFGESDSDNRAHDALKAALKSPLMDRGRMLSEATNVLVQVAGGPAMTFSEVEILMRELNKHIGEQTQIFFGTSVDGRMGNRLSVTIISSLAGEEQAVVRPAKIQKPKIVPKPIPEPAMVFEEPKIIEPEPIEEPLPEIVEAVEEPEPVQSTSEPEPEPEAIAAEVSEPFDEPPAPEPIPIAEHPAKKKVLWPKEPKRPAGKPLLARQEVLQFEPVTRGRFEKSEPTIIEGQDLDVPTYLRKNVRVK